MDLLNTIQNDVMKLKEEETQNNFERVADFRDIISETQPEPGVSVTLKLCCISAERLSGGRGTRFTGIDGSQRNEFEATLNALSELTPLKKKPYITQVTVWDGKPIKGSYAKANFDFQPGAAYAFRKVDGVGYYAEIAKGNVQYERGVADKVFEVEPPLKKRKLDETPKKGKGKATASPSYKRALFPASSGDDVSMTAEEKTEERREVMSTMWGDEYTRLGVLLSRFFFSFVVVAFSVLFFFSFVVAFFVLAMVRRYLSRCIEFWWSRCSEQSQWRSPFFFIALSLVHFPPGYWHWCGANCRVPLAVSSFGIWCD